MNDSKKGGLFGIIFVLVLAIVLGGSGYMIFKSPARISATTGGNYTANLMNGGHLLDDGDYIYFSVPEKDGIWCVKADGSDLEQISKSGCGNLQTDSGNYYFTDESKLIACSLFGQNASTVLENARNPYIVGDRIYYIDENGYACKYLKWNGEKRELGIKTGGQMIVYSARIYYVGEDGYIHKCALDGTDDKVIFENKTDMFSIDGQLMYALSGGEIHMISMKGDNTDTEVLCKADAFTVNSGWVMYNADGKCLLGELTKMVTDEDYTPDCILENEADALQIGENSFYVYDGDKLQKLPFDTGKLEDFIALK